MPLFQGCLKNVHIKDLWTGDGLIYQFLSKIDMWFPQVTISDIFSFLPRRVAGIWPFSRHDSFRGGISRGNFALQYTVIPV